VTADLVLVAVDRRRRGLAATRSTFGKLTLDRLRVAEVTGLYATPGEVVIAEQNESGRAVLGSRPSRWFSVASRDDSVALLPDGRLVLAYIDFGATSGDDRCVVAAWDTAGGNRRADVRLYRTARAVGNRCSEFYPVEAGNGVALTVSQRGVVMLG
jgi:hypothetical protein